MPYLFRSFLPVAFLSHPICHNAYDSIYFVLVQRCKFVKFVDFFSHGCTFRTGARHGCTFFRTPPFISDLRHHRNEKSKFIWSHTPFKVIPIRWMSLDGLPRTLETSYTVAGVNWCLSASVTVKLRTVRVLSIATKR